MLALSFAPRPIFAPRPMQAPKGPLQRLNLPFVINLLPLGQFQRFQNILHFIERVFQFIDDLIHLLDGLADRSHAGSGLRFLRANRLGAFGERSLFNRLHSLRRVSQLRLLLCWTRTVPPSTVAAAAPRAAGTLRGCGCRLFGTSAGLFFRNHITKVPVCD